MEYGGVTVMFFGIPFLDVPDSSFYHLHMRKGTGEVERAFILGSELNRLYCTYG